MIGAFTPPARSGLTMSHTVSPVASPTLRGSRLVAAAHKGLMAPNLDGGKPMGSAYGVSSVPPMSEAVTAYGDDAVRPGSPLAVLFGLMEGGFLGNVTPSSAARTRLLRRRRAWTPERRAAQAAAVRARMADPAARRRASPLRLVVRA